MQQDELAERVFASLLGAMETVSIHLGDHFGIYRYLHEHGAATEAQVAEACGVAPRYAREWLEQQTVAGFLEVDDPGLPAEERRYTLPVGHAAVLVDRDSLLYSTPFTRVFAAAAAQLPALTEAYRTGGGVGWSTFGDLMRTGQAEANRPLFLGPLGTEILPSLDGTHDRLTAGGRVADVGCGEGWSSIGIARAYPDAEVHGYDVDPASIERPGRTPSHTASTAGSPSPWSTGGSCRTAATTTW